MRIKNKIVCGLLAFMMSFGSAQNSLSWNIVWLKLVPLLAGDVIFFKYYEESHKPDVLFLIPSFNFLLGFDICRRFMNGQSETEQNKQKVKRYKETIEYYKNLYGSTDQYDENGKKIL